jgi:DNA anti-recombination protein RmuC
LDDYLIGVIWAVIDLILLLFFLKAASYLDNLKSNDEERNRPNYEPSRGKFRQQVKLEPLVRSIAELKQLLQPISEIIQRHERILSGAQSKGALGEQIVWEKLKDLPPEWWDHDVPLNGATVEFALRVPNKRWVPIDSQWTATRLLDQLGRATDQLHRNVFRAQVQEEVTRRAKEARNYIDKDCTLGFCIVAVPDPVFELSIDIQAKLTSSDIVLISYSLLVPYLLLIVNQFLKTPESADALRMSHVLSRSSSQIEVIQKYINEKVMPPLHTVTLQQTQHHRRNRGIEHVHGNVDEIQSDLNRVKSELNEIQSELSVVRNMYNPIPNKDIDSIPQTLQRYLNLVRDGLLEGVSKENGHNPDSTDK